MLRLQGLTHRFGRQAALDAVSLHVRLGDCYGLLGHNGAGKTTVLRIALGLLPPQEGSVRVAGFDALQHPAEARTRLGGLIETPGFHGQLSGRQNLLLLGRLAGLSGAAARTEADRLLALLGLSDATGKPVRAYSQGMRQRLGLAQALLGRPACVVLDEPLNGLDPEGIAELRALIGRLVRDQGITVLLSSHQLGEVATLCNRVGILRAGRLLLEGETEALLRASQRRYRIAGADHAALDQALRAMGLSPQAADPRGWRVELAERAPGTVLRALVQQGLDLTAFAPDPPSLEEVYLAATTTQGEALPPLPPVVRPSPRIAPRGGIRRVLGYDLRRLLHTRGMLLLLPMPAMLGAAAIGRRYLELERDRAEVAARSTFSATDVTAFEAMAVALQAGVPLAMALAAAFASQSVAGELQAGTLRNVLLRPLTRLQLGLGKLLAALLLTAALYGGLVLAATAAAAWLFDFGDVVEILPNGKRFPMVAAEALWPELRRALWTPALPLAATAGLGFLIGCATRGGAAALALTLLALLFGDLLRGPARAGGILDWLPQTHLPSPLGDTSFVRAFAALAQGASDVTPSGPGPMMSACACWLLATASLSLLLLRRKPVA